MAVLLPSAEEYAQVARPVQDTNEDQFLCLHPIRDDVFADGSEEIALVLDDRTDMPRTRESAEQLDRVVNPHVQAFGGVGIVAGDEVADPLDVSVRPPGQERPTQGTIPQLAPRPVREREVRMEANDGVPMRESPAGGVQEPSPARRLDEERRALRGQFQARPLTAEEQQTAEDIAWAQRDPDVQAKYRGEFVVPCRRTIVAHGHDLAALVEQAATLLGKRKEDIPVVGVIDPLLDIPH